MRKCIDCCYPSRKTGEIAVEITVQTRNRIRNNQLSDSTYRDIFCHHGYLTKYDKDILDINIKYKSKTERAEKCSKYFLSLECPVPCWLFLKDKWEKYRPNVSPTVMVNKAVERRRNWLYIALTIVGIVVTIFLTLNNN